MEKFVDCWTIEGTKKLVNAKKLSFRPSVYAFIIQDGKLLLTVVRTTEKFWLPGGAVDQGEPFEDALKREVREECGIDVIVDTPLFFRERFFYYEPKDSASHLSMMFYRCRPIGSDLLLGTDVEDEAIDPQWVSIASLKSEDFQLLGDDVMQYLKSEELNAE